MKSSVFKDLEVRNRCKIARHLSQTGQRAGSTRSRPGLGTLAPSLTHAADDSSCSLLGSFVSAVSGWFWGIFPPALQVALYLGLSPRAAHEGGKESEALGTGNM